MRTSELIRILASETGSPAELPARHRFAFATVAGVGAATLLMLITLRLRSDLVEATLLPMFWGKLAFAGCLAAMALLLVKSLSMPGQPLGFAPLLLAAPPAMMWVAGAQELASTAAPERSLVLLGQTWAVCPALIAMLATPVLGATIWAIRGLAPTRLRSAGAAAGLFSGAAGAAVYSLHCPEMAPSFIGTWYLLGILLPTAVGAAVGPRLLRW